MDAAQVTVLTGTTFLVGDQTGDVDPDPAAPTGLFHRDMRHLSRWQLRLDGQVLDVLCGSVVEATAAVFFLVEATGTVYRNADVSLVRRRCIGTGLQESLELTNAGMAPRTVELVMYVDADFADIFEVKDRLAKVGRVYRRVGDAEVVLGYVRGGFRRETRIHAPGAVCAAGSLTYRVTLAPHVPWRATIDIALTTSSPRPSSVPETPDGLAAWLAAAPRLVTGDDGLRQAYRTSLTDLAALRLYPDSVPGSLPAAGLPWFMALFGRDSLITSYQVLPFLPQLCRTTLRALAALQAHRMDDFTDAEPGKILHELRHGELTYFGERPHSPYYGAADSTPLFLIVLDEYERWTGDVETVRELEGAARAALRWVEEYGEVNGFISYRSRNPTTGIVNQCWKDSANSIVYPDGTPAALPHAVCEIQGYAYDARVRTARLARECWGDPALADRLDRDAAALRTRFDAAFWLPDEGFYALALDGAGQPVPTLTSNIGHLLWSGIVPDERVDPLVGHLLGERMFTGWGVRTLAAGQPAYNPMEYHNGAVWPHDNALIVAGLARYGRRTEAARLAEAVLAAAPHVAYRLPEALVGVSREVMPVPVPYASACSPQAWAAGTPLLLLRVLLGLEPSVTGPLVDPYLPSGLGPVTLLGVPGRRT